MVKARDAPGAATPAPAHRCRQPSCRRRAWRLASQLRRERTCTRPAAPPRLSPRPWTRLPPARSARPSQRGRRRRRGVRCGPGATQGQQFEPGLSVAERPMRAVPRTVSSSKKATRSTSTSPSPATICEARKGSESVRSVWTAALLRNACAVYGLTSAFSRRVAAASARWRSARRGECLVASLAAWASAGMGVSGREGAVLSNRDGARLLHGVDSCDSGRESMAPRGLGGGRNAGSQPRGPAWLLPTSSLVAVHRRTTCVRLIDHSLHTRARPSGLLERCGLR